MSATLDKIIEEVRALSPEEQEQLRDMLNAMSQMMLMEAVVELLTQLRRLKPEEIQRMRDFMNRQPPISEQTRRAIRSRAIRGKYAHISTSSDEFIALKREETRLEDSKFKDRP